MGGEDSDRKRVLYSCSASPPCRELPTPLRLIDGVWAAMTGGSAKRQATAEMWADPRFSSAVETRKNRYHCVPELLDRKGTACIVDGGLDRNPENSLLFSCF